MRNLKTYIFILTVFFSGGLAHAQIVTTEQIVSDVDTHAQERQKIYQALVEYGVDPNLARQRVDSLSDSEIASIEQTLNESRLGGKNVDEERFAYNILILIALIFIVPVLLL